MVLYEVTVEIEAELAEAFAAYMRDKHIPEIWRTGCFAAIRFEQAGPQRFRTCYAAATQADLDSYLSAHTAHFRADFLAHFPRGATAGREIWTVAQEWR